MTESLKFTFWFNRCILICSLLHWKISNSTTRRDVINSLTSLWYLCIRNFSTIFVTKSIICQENDRVVTKVMLWLMQYQSRCKYRIRLGRDFICAIVWQLCTVQKIYIVREYFLCMYIYCVWIVMVAYICPQHAR